MRIAIWTESRWAMGRIHQNIVNVLQKEEWVAHVELFDWLDAKNTQRMLQNWRQWDVILGNTALNYQLKDLGFFKEIPLAFLGRTVSILHCPKIDHPGFTEKITNCIGPVFGGVCQGAIATLETTYGIHAAYTPFGADLNVFCERKAKVEKICRAGFCCRPQNYNSIKRLDIFEEICKLANLEPVLIHGRPLTDSLYDDIDLLICASDFESGPLGIFEAAACGIPTLLRRNPSNGDNTSNASKIQGIATFETAVEAAEIIRGWNENPTLLQEYARNICAEVRTNWGMEHLIRTHLLPVLKNKVGVCYDFVEIGTSDFDTLVEKAEPEERGLCVEPVRYYLDRLQKRPLVQRVCAAISSEDAEQVSIYSISEETRRRLGLPNWVRGCNSVGSPHPTVVKLLAAILVDDGVGKFIDITSPQGGAECEEAWKVEYVPQISFRTLARQFNIGQVVHLKLVTEGHDCIILQDVARAIEDDTLPFRPPNKITFQTNILSSAAAQTEIIHKFTTTFGYQVTSSGGGNNTVLERRERGKGARPL
jgi:hypothetical protein